VRRARADSAEKELLDESALQRKAIHALFSMVNDRVSDTVKKFRRRENKPRATSRRAKQIFVALPRIVCTTGDSSADVGKITALLTSLVSGFLHAIQNRQKWG
jgi:hypothetical protein